MELDVSTALVLSLGALGLGMIMLIRGGNWTIDAAVHIANNFGISPLVIGFTVVAFGTSLPELIVSINANMSGVPGIALGNVIGSNIANILFVLGLTATIATVSAKPREIRNDLAMMIVATLAFIAAMLAGTLDRYVGGAMVLALVGYSGWQYRTALSGGREYTPETGDPHFASHKTAALFLILGLAFIAMGAEFLVRGAKVSAATLGVPADIIGLSVVAAGTSLPELSTSIVAARKGQSDMILGNIVGSNVFNIFFILGITALIKPVDLERVAPQMFAIDIWVMLAIALVFTLILLFYRRINRMLGISFLVFYCLYIGIMYELNMG